MAMSGCIAPAVAATRPAGGSVALWRLPVPCCLRRHRPDGMAPSHEAPVVMTMWRLSCSRPGVSENACPVLFSSDGGVYFNTKETSPDCHRPFWQQPNVTPHALWLWALAGSNQPGVLAEDLYFGNQDNGSFRNDQCRGAEPHLDQPGLLRRLRRQLQSVARPLHNMLFLSPAWESLVPSQSRHGGRSRDKHLSARRPSGFPTHRCDRQLRSQPISSWSRRKGYSSPTM